MSHPVRSHNLSFEDHTRDLAALNEDLQLDPSKTAAITIDMHRGHLDPDLATMPVPPEIAARVVRDSAVLLDGLRSIGVPVIHVVVTYRKDEAHNFNPRVTAGRTVFSHTMVRTPAMLAGTLHNLQGSRQCEIMPELGPTDSDRVVDTKKTLSSFLGTELQEMLRRYLAVQNVILLGINTNTCVQCAAFECMNYGLRVVVPPECVASMYGDDLHESALQNIARCLGWVVPRDDILAKLRSYEAPPSSAI